MSLPANFDPRTVPFQVDTSGLPPVAPERLAKNALIDRFARSRDWVPEYRHEPRMSDRSLTPASVLIGLVMRDRPTVLLTQRTAHLSSHSGQVAFPGGKADADDAGPVATALREAQEEVGLSAEFVTVLGSLPNYTTGSQFVITPVVGLLHPELELSANAFEVESIFEVPLDFLMNPAHHRHHFMATPAGERQWLSMPYHDGTAERYIWGATAGLLRNLYQFLSL
ncbi:MAG: CoA pyrophosphatase [Rhodoferax sp.]|nr:CoA pyrophosphatase [Rhodoferax sp.]